MSIITYLIKELYYKTIYILLLYITILTIIIYKIKTIFLFIISPIKQTKINNFLIKYQEIKQEFNSQIIENNIQNHIPIIEINLPFFTTSYIYFKYIILLSVYITIPIIIYYIYISITPILKKNEIFLIKQITGISFIFIYINYILIHYIVIPFYLNFIYSHYNEFLYYEFDVEFQITIFLDFYFKIIYYSLFFFISILLKKYMKLNINNLIIYFIFLMIMPLDTTIQIIYTILFIFYNITINIIYYYSQNIKKYKQKEYLETY